MKKFSRFILMMAIACVAAFIFTGNGLNAKAAEETYLIGTDTTFAPFEFEKDGEHVGIDMDILKAIAKDQNFKYEIKAMGFNAAVQALEANQVDGVIAGMSITDERKQKFDFSDPYFDSGVVMGILKDNDEIKTYDDLKGKKSSC